VIHAYVGAASIVEVEVDMETGKVEILKSHQPMIAEKHQSVMVDNQIDLGLAMANGWCAPRNILWTRRRV